MISRYINPPKKNEIIPQTVQTAINVGYYICKFPDLRTVSLIAFAIKPIQAMNNKISTMWIITKTR